MVLQKFGVPNFTLHAVISWLRAPLAQRREPAVRADAIYVSAKSLRSARSYCSDLVDLAKNLGRVVVFPKLLKRGSASAAAWASWSVASSVTGFGGVTV